MCGKPSQWWAYTTPAMYFDRNKEVPYALVHMKSQNVPGETGTRDSNTCGLSRNAVLFAKNLQAPLILRQLAEIAALQKAKTTLDSHHIWSL